MCQDVWRWNTSFSRELKEDALRPRALFDGRGPRELAIELLAMSEESYVKEFRGSPMKRAKRRGLARNAAVVLGNVGDETDAELLNAISSDADPMVKEHLDWARQRIA